MTPELAAFSDWTLALLPRLFLYPGGLSLLVGLLLLRLASSGVSSISVRALRDELLRANLLSVALAWVAVALAPFPGIGLLPTPVDALVLAALPALSLLLDASATSGRYIAAAGAVTLALVLPPLASNVLLLPATGSALLLAVSWLATIPALLALAWMGNDGMAAQMRWLAWLSLGTVQAWQRFPGDSAWAAGLVVLALIIVLNGTARPVQTSFLGREGELRPVTPRFYPPGDLGARGATAIAWLLALLGLGWALLAGS